MAVTNDYGDGLYKRDWSNTNWINFNDTEDCYRRTWDNNGWDKGSAENGIVFRRNSSNTGWVQIYPKGIIIVPDPPVISAKEVNMFNYQKNYSGWTPDFARQGYVTVSGGGGEQFGLITLSSSLITGSGSITETGDVTFWGRTGASGNYNNDNTISFRGTTHAENSGNPFLSGGAWDPNPPFTFYWQSGGKNSPIDPGPVAGSKDTLLRWMNNIGGYGRNLCIYNGENSGSWSRNYLSVTQFNMKIQGYKYQANRMIFDRPKNRAKFFSLAALGSVPTDENYLDIVVPNNMTNLSVEQAIHKIESGELDEVKPTSMITLSESGVKPKIMQVENDIIRVSHVPSGGVFVQYEGKDNMWRNGICVAPLQYKIPEGIQHVRLIDTETGEIFSDMLL